MREQSEIKKIIIMRKMLLFFTAIQIASVCLCGQTLKTHSTTEHGGKMTYTYYDDAETGKEVRHGALTYTFNDKGDGATLSRTIKGKFKHGYKHGVWVYTIKEVDVPGGGNGYYTGTTKMTATFSDGMPNGAWTYSSNYKARVRNYTLSGWRWGAYEAQKPVNISVTFNNGNLVGKVKFKTTYANTNGTLDSEGFMIGKWTREDSKPKLFYKRAEIDTRATPEDQKLMKQALELKGEELNKFCRQHRVQIDTFGTKNYFNLNDGYFNNFAWLHRAIGGDKTYIVDEYGRTTDTKTYGKQLQVKKVKIIRLSELVSERDKSNARALRDILELYGLEISDEDQLYLNNLIDSLELAEEKERVNKIHYEKTMAKIKEYKQVYTVSVTNYYGEESKKKFNIDDSLSFKEKDIYIENLKSYKSYGYSKPTPSKEVERWLNYFDIPITMMKNDVINDKERLDSLCRIIVKEIPRNSYSYTFDNNVDHSTFPAQFDPQITAAKDNMKKAKEIIEIYKKCRKASEAIAAIDSNLGEKKQNKNTTIQLFGTSKKESDKIAPIDYSSLELCHHLTPTLEQIKTASEIPAIESNINLIYSKIDTILEIKQLYPTLDGLYESLTAQKWGKNFTTETKQYTHKQLNAADISETLTSKLNYLKTLSQFLSQFQLVEDNRENKHILKAYSMFIEECEEQMKSNTHTISITRSMNELLLIAKKINMLNSDDSKALNKAIRKEKVIEQKKALVLEQK